MPRCSVCDEELVSESKSCPVCGTQVSQSEETIANRPHSPDETLTPVIETARELVHESVATLGEGKRQCPQCNAIWGADYTDDFCPCGAELTAAADNTRLLEESASRETMGPRTSRPAAGSVCLVVYDANRQPLHYHEIDEDVTLIGRSDPIRGDFPDLDVSRFADDTTSERVSRKHALLLRSRETKSYTLRPLAQNTGTQIEKELVKELQDYPISDGTRVVLGGVIRLKIEVIK